MKQTSPITLLGIPFLPLTEREFRARLARLAIHGRTAHVFTPNPEMLLLSKNDPEFHTFLCDADLLLPDGIGILLGARIRGTPLPARATGIDSAEWLLSFAAKHSLRVFLLGGRCGVAEDAARTLAARFDGLSICGTHHGYFDKAKESPENKAVLALLREAKPDLLFVCFGAPAQEKWISENADEIPSLRLCMGLGGALDVWSGRVERAPRLWQKLGLEWLWRTLREPKRIRRLTVLPKFLWIIYRSSFWACRTAASKNSSTS